MADIRRSNFCCGVREIGNLDAKGADIIRLINHTVEEDDMDGAFWWWADNTDSPHARNLAAYFKKYKLGEVTKIGAAFNPQSGNELEMFVIELDKDALYEWIERFGATKRPVMDKVNAL